MRNFWHFLQYHNAVPIALGIMVMGAGATFAATNPEAIYSQAQTVVSIDNTYLVDKDLSQYTPKVQITGVTEDEDNYYVTYKFSTIDLDDAAWKDVVKDETITVSKADLGPYRDLGVYVTQQLKQNVDRELARLRDTQEIEKRNVSQKVVATSYGGLVGKFLDTTTETLPGYTPVVEGPPPPPVSEVAAASSDGSSSSSGVSGSTAGTTGTYAVIAVSSGDSSLRMQLLGNNPAQIPLRSSYVDLGAVVSNAKNDNIGIHVFKDGEEVQQIQINTSTTSTTLITYRATDPQGNSVSLTRTVYVYDPVVGQPVPDSQVQNAALLPPPTTTQTTEAATTTQASQTTTGTSQATSTQETATTTASTTTSQTSQTAASTESPAATTTQQTTTSTDTSATATAVPAETATSTQGTSSPSSTQQTGTTSTATTTSATSTTP